MELSVVVKFVWKKYISLSWLFNEIYIRSRLSSRINPSCITVKNIVFGCYPIKKSLVWFGQTVAQWWWWLRGHIAPYSYIRVMTSFNSTWIPLEQSPYSPDLWLPHVWVLNKGLGMWAIRQPRRRIGWRKAHNFFVVKMYFF